MTTERLPMLADAQMNEAQKAAAMPCAVPSRP